MAYDPATLLPAYTAATPPGDTLAVADHDEGLHELDRQELRGLKSDWGLTPSAATLQGYVRAGNANGAGLWLPAHVVAGAGLSPVINAAPRIWQRGTSFSSVADGTYTADRWRYGKSGAMVHDVSRSTSVPTVAALVPRSNYSLLVDCTTVDSSIASGDYCILEHRILGENWLVLDQVATAWSFWHKHTKTGTYSVALVNGGGDRSCVATYTQAVSDTWELATVTFPASPSAGTWNYTTGIGARLVFALAAGSTFQTTAGAWQSGLFYATSGQVNACDSTSNNFQIWGVQPAVGTVALPYVPLPFEVELFRCLPYYTKTLPYATAPAQNSGVSNGTLGYFCYASGAVTSSVVWRFPVRMRATPTLVALNPDAANGKWRNQSDAADSGTAAFDLQGDAGCIVYNPQVAGDGQGERLAVHCTADAEL